jgi:hypothetical protein
VFIKSIESSIDVSCESKIFTIMKSIELQKSQAIDSDDEVLEAMVPTVEIMEILI